MPQISLYYQPSFKDSTVNISRQDWEVSYNLGNSWNKVKRNKKANSSLYKVDITIYPELSLKNLVITQIYQVLFNLSPAIEVSFWKGMKFTAQMVIPVYNDGYASRSLNYRKQSVCPIIFGQHWLSVALIIADMASTST